MIKKSDFEKVLPRTYEELRSLEEKIEQLLKERDAYREVAIERGCGECLNSDEVFKREENVDAEAKRIIEEKRNKK